MAGTVIADVEVIDAAGFEDYRARVPATIARYGGRYLVRGGATEQREGDWSPRRLIVLEFPSLARARMVRVAGVRAADRAAPAHGAHAHRARRGRLARAQGASSSAAAATTSEGRAGLARKRTPRSPERQSPISTTE